MRKKILIPFLLTAVLVTACYVTVCGKSSRLTKEQEALLKAMEDSGFRIPHNDKNWKKKAVEQSEIAMDYLDKKYPGHAFSFEDCSLMGNGNLYTTLWFTADGEDDLYILYITKENGDYFRKDNFYGFLIQDDYDRTLYAMIQKKIPSCIGVSSKFTSVQGEDITGDLSFDEILEKKILNLTCIYMEGSVPDLENSISNLKDFLRENKIYGSYYIKVLNGTFKDQSGKEIESLISKDKNIVLSEMHYNQFD